MTGKDTHKYELLAGSELRISIASFVRIMNADGKYALLINKNKLKKEKKVFTPIG